MSELAAEAAMTIVVAMLLIAFLVALWITRK